MLLRIMEKIREQLTGKAAKDFKRQQKLVEKEASQRKRSLWKLANGTLIGLVVFGIAALAFFYFKNQPTTGNLDIISQSGIHWHPNLAIYIKGQKQVIPSNIGLGFKERPIHTHDDSGIIHLEFSGVVAADDIKLENFFKIWNKRFNRDCIFDYCNGADGAVKFFINSKSNDEFESYKMRDGDQIEIKYE